MGEPEATIEKIRLWGCKQKDKLLNSYKQIAKNGESGQEITSSQNDAENIE